MRRSIAGPVFALAMAAFGCDDGSDEGPGALCTTSLDCGQQEICRDGTCEFVPCSGDASCGEAKLRCAEDGLCVLRDGFADACDAERPCPFGQFCSTLLGRCFDASSSRTCDRRSDCPDGQLCDREAAQCVPDLGCFGPEFCDPDELCNPLSRECEIDDRVLCTPCRDDGACEGVSCDEEQRACVENGESGPCPTGTRCSPAGQCVQCQVDADCGEGLVCNTLRGRCESNLRCADSRPECPDGDGIRCVVCERPLECNPLTNRCEAPPPPCDDDTDCTENQRCDTTADPPVCVVRPPECLDDVLDEAMDNGSVGTRSPIGQGVRDELILCPGDVDWYGLEVPAGTEVTVDLRFAQADGDLELQVFLEDGRTVVAEGRTVTDNERVRFAIGTERNLAIRVASAVPLPTDIPYRLRVAFDPAEPCEDDAFEENDSRAQAGPLPTFQTVSAQLCPADPDWYRLEDLPPSSSVDLSLDFVPGLGDLRLEVFRAGEPTPLLVSDEANAPEFLRVPAGFGGDLWVRVSGQRTDANPYGLRAEVFEDPTQACPDDPREPNDGPTTSSTLTEDFSGERTICPGDEDWYALDFPGGGGVLAVELAHDPQIDLDVSLYRDVPDPLRSAPVAEGRRLGRREYFTFSSFQREDLLLRVFGATPGDIGRYTLRTFTEASFVCQPDAADAAGVGNTIQNPFDLGQAPLRSQEFTLCIEDEDFVRLTLPPGFAHEIRLQWRRQNVELDFDLLDENGAAFDVDPTPGANVTATDVVIEGSPVPVILRPFTAELPLPTDYRVVVDSRPVLRCDGDPFDPNDLPEAAAELTLPFAQMDLELCPSQQDSDWYALPELGPGERVEAEIRFSSSDLLLELVRADDPRVRPCEDPTDPEQRCLSDGFDGTERVGYTATSSISLLLRVSSVFSSPQVPVPDGADTDYALEVTRSAP